MSYDQIDKYLDGELTGKALEDFEAALKSDPKLAAKVKLHQRIPEAIMEQEVVNLEEKMKAIFSEATEESAPTPAKMFTIRRIMMIAASVLFLIIAGWWTALNLGSTSTEQLFADYMSSPPNLVPSELSRLRDTSDQSQKQEIINLWKQFDELYQGENTKTALETLDSIRFLDPEFKDYDQSAYYYALGLIQLQNENSEEALIAFERIASDPNNDMARWYYALTLILLERSTEAIPILETIADAIHPKKTEASELLEKLKN